MTPARFVLVRPRNPNNIGAVARAMANFGLKELFVVDPYAPVWEEARSAVGGETVLAEARAAALPEALRGAELVLGTSDGRRALRRPLIALPGLRAYLDETLPPGGRLAVLFGSEKTGLRNEDLAHCHALVRIPTRSEAPSMNLGQAAAVVAYELSRTEERPRLPKLPLAGAEQREDLIERAVLVMKRLGYRENEAESAKAERLRALLLRWPLVRKDAALLQAVLKRIAGL